MDADEPEGIKAAVRGGAALEPLDASGCTPLLRAVGKGSLAAARVLLAYGADPNAVMQGHPLAVASHPHGNVLMTAIRCCEVEFLEHLLESGVSIRDASGEAAGPLLAAAELAKPDTLEKLLLAGAEVNASCYGRRALHSAAARGRSKSVRLLLTKGAEVDPVDGEGRTPLWLAVHTLKTEVVAILVKAGAEVGRKDVHGESPLDCARKMKASIAISFRKRVEKMMDLLTAQK